MCCSAILSELQDCLKMFQTLMRRMWCSVTVAFWCHKSRETAVVCICAERCGHLFLAIKQSSYSVKMQVSSNHSQIGAIRTAMSPLSQPNCPT